MKNSTLLAMAGVVMLATSLLTTPSNGAERQKAAKATSTKTEMYAVVQIGEEVKVVRKSELANLQKSTNEEDKRKLKEYQDAKKGAGKGEDKSELIKPVKRTVRTLKSSLKTEQDANDWKDKFLEEKEGKDGTKTRKKTDNW